MSDLELLLWLVRNHPELLELAIQAAQRLGLWPIDRVGPEDIDPFIWDEETPDAFDQSCNN